MKTRLDPMDVKNSLKKKMGSKYLMIKGLFILLILDLITILQNYLNLHLLLRTYMMSQSFWWRRSRAGEIKSWMIRRKLSIVELPLTITQKLISLNMNWLMKMIWWIEFLISSKILSSLIKRSCLILRPKKKKKC